MGETKVEVITAAYKVHVHCNECARELQARFTEFPGIHEVKVDAGAGKVTVKGVGYDVEKLRVKVEKNTRKKIEIISPKKAKKGEKEEEKVFEIKIKKEEVKVITVKVPLHCPECEARAKEILLQHKSIYNVKTDLGKNTCTVEGVLEEKKLVEYIREKTRKRGVVEKVEKKVIIKEEKVEVVKKKEEKKEEIKEKIKDIVAPYFIPCTHPRFIDYSHPSSQYCSYDNYYSSYDSYYNMPYRYPYFANYSHSEFKDYQDTAFLHCSHSHEYFSEENPYACSVM